MNDSLDLLPDAVFVLDADQRIALVNEAALAALGFTREELKGEVCGERLEVRDRHGRRIWKNGWPRSSALRSVTRLPEQIVTLRRSDGSEWTAAASGVYRRSEDGKLTGAIFSLRRPSHQDGANVSAIEIVSTVSHELRSPLTSVKGYTSLMLNRWDRLQDDQKQMMLEQVNHDADRVTRLITELLDISRLESGRLVLRRQMVDLARIAANVVEKVAMEYPELSAETVFPPDLPKVYADPDKVEQVLTNLVENACKYASPRDMRIEGSCDDGNVSVCVTDHGEGIPESDLPKVFSKFFRRSVGKPTGSGLGLWISRGLVESHGGDLSAESKLGQGSTFRFTLPLLDLDKLQEQ
jgi:PAS domain S-box-containing protein